MTRRSPTPMPIWKLDTGTLLWAQRDNGEDEALNDWIYEHLGTLPNTEGQPHRAVVEMRIWGRYTFQEIADELGLNGRSNAHGLYDRAIDWLLNGRVVTVGAGEKAFKVKFRGMKEDMGEWL